MNQRTQLDKMKLSYYRFNPLSYDTIEQSEIYLAKPGHRVIGRLNGIDESTCSLEINLNNTAILEFSIPRIVDGEITNYYDLINRHYELYVTHFGWFKINEEPELSNDGNIETKAIRAESGEIELQQFDKINFEINTGTVSSREMLAPDNTYEVVGYKLPHDNIRFYRDTTDIEELIDALPPNATKEDLIQLIQEHHYTCMFKSWRFQFDMDSFNSALNPTIAYYQSKGVDTTDLEQCIDADISSSEAYELIMVYPELLTYIDNYDIDVKDPDHSDLEINMNELFDLELQREKKLSFLDLVLEETGWKPGYIDPSYDLSSDDLEEQIPLSDKVGKFEVESQDVYSFLMQEASQYFKCIFDFDTENYLVNAYRIESLGIDTNIFLSFHNIQNSVTRSSDRDLYTVYSVANGTGEEKLDIKEANLGETEIEDLSYFMNEDHFSQATIQKYNEWKAFREEKRIEYMELAIQQRDEEDKLDEINSRVPTDGINTAQYGTMTVEQLEAERENYRAQLKGYESLYVDENGDFDIDALMQSTDWADYQLIKNYVLSVPDPSLVCTLNGETYEGIIDDKIITNPDFLITYSPSAHLGYIDTEIYNRWMIQHYSTSEGSDGLTKLEFDEEYMYNLEVYGDAYGLQELQTLSSDLYGKVYSYGEYADIDLTDPTLDDYHRQQKLMYDKYKHAYDVSVELIGIRQQEYDDQQELINSLAQQYDAIKESTYKDNYGFTTAELWLLQRYMIHTDYVNENIVVTDISTNRQIVEQENLLYQDALEELYADSHPQWNFSTTQDNLLLMPELQDWHGQLEIGNFIRVGFREDDPYYVPSKLNENQVKLRLVTVRLNPFMVDPTIELVFSNMVQYKSKRNDFVDILGNGGGSSKNSITSSYSKHAETADTVNVTTDFIMKIINNPAFTSNSNSIINRASGVASGAAIGAVSGQLSGLVTDAINHMNITVDQIGDLTTRLSDLVNGYVDANVITSKVIISDVVTADAINAQSATIQNISAQTVNATNVISALVSADQGDFHDLSANTAFIEYLNSGVIETGQITADSLVATMAQITSAQIETLSADSAFMNYLNTNLVVAEAAHISNLAADMANINVLTSSAITSDSAFFTSLQSLSSSAATSVIDDAYIYNAVAGRISVADLMAHTATADQIVLISQDGNPSIAFKGSTQQFYDSDGNVRVQIGQDGNGDFNFIVKGADGTTALFNENGITQNGIPNNTIVNNMISDSTIEKAKLNFPIIETNPDGTINITDIKDGSGGNFGVEYTTFKQNTSDAIDEINSQKMYRVEITSSNGNYFKNGNVSTVLSCHVYSWDDEITDDLNASVFKWTKINNDGTSDQAWNSAHFGGAKTVTITSADVSVRGTFICTVTLPDGTSISSGD